MEIGGYIQLDNYSMPMLHDGLLALNTARNCLAYIIEAKDIKKIRIPLFLCSSVSDVCKRTGVEIKYYSIKSDLTSLDCQAEADEWIYIVNYYGQLTNEKIEAYKKKHANIIIDNVQAYYQQPVEGVDTIYTCRKFFGVSDGAFLSTEKFIKRELEEDISYKRMEHLLGRFEKTASEFYAQYTYNEEAFVGQPIKKMSKLTNNLLHAIDYEAIKKCRTKNYKILYDAFSDINKLKLIIPEGAFMYPLYIDNGYKVRKLLQKNNIYIPLLWPDVVDICKEGTLEYELARNILPLPVDQRYSEKDMIIIIEEVFKYIKEG